MMILLRKLYCKGCRKNTLHIIVVQKMDLGGHFFHLRGICLEPTCNDKRDIETGANAVMNLMKRTRDDEPETQDYL